MTEEQVCLDNDLFFKIFENSKLIYCKILIGKNTKNYVGLKQGVLNEDSLRNIMNGYPGGTIEELTIDFACDREDVPVSIKKDGEFSYHPHVKPEEEAAFKSWFMCRYARLKNK
jgi:hypothetical protein